MLERRRITIRGIVQGVGFRPFVYGLASEMRLFGFVKNLGGGVRIEVEGEKQQLDRFVEQVRTQAPPLAIIEDFSLENRAPQNETSFRIESSDEDLADAPVNISPDVATCKNCLAELFDPKDRRYRYPFLNCTHCGPRLTIVTGAPYDRARTTMAKFAMCPACQREYDDPTNRRFHAQPTACPVCGPKLQLLDGSGGAITGGDPLLEFARRIVEGKIGAMKGLGGFHLICNARNEAAVSELRIRKYRDEKPFAIMVDHVDSVGAICEIDERSTNLLTSPRAPIVLLRKRPASSLAGGVAPGNPYLGVMLPYTPFHHLLMDAVGHLPLVMTSGNTSDEPIAFENGDAVGRLKGIADFFLVHDRPIYMRCDDSVTRVIAGKESILRRSRGYAPEPIALPIQCAMPILAVGGQLKATFALGADSRAILSQHMGDLDHLEAYRAFERDIDLFEQLFSITPEVVVHDLHPQYASTAYAQRRKRKNGVRLIGVQHHHAHMAACMAENQLTAPVIGVSFDGTGYGVDGAIWGGEFLVGDYKAFRRAAHLRYVAMPGGEQAIREPWRMAISHLMDAGCECYALNDRLQPAALSITRQMIKGQINSSLTSSAGRLFDAVASIVGVRDRVTYEGQAAIELEWRAGGMAGDDSYRFTIARELEGPWIIDTRPLIQAVVADLEKGAGLPSIAARFHNSIAQMILQTCEQLKGEFGITTVTLSGGVFMNARLVFESTRRLEAAGFQVFRHSLVPANDGGLSLGQLAIAAATISQEPAGCAKNG
ncbi:MAG TPA: carbamoyltransferase HypF [Tepidisphaeraceae bacterium]|nr:carbamoyltransferase HypF [Tepidisphaeraceae bacterium]